MLCFKQSHREVGTFRKVYMIAMIACVRAPYINEIINVVLNFQPTL